MKVSAATTPKDTAKAIVIASSSMRWRNSSRRRRRFSSTQAIHASAGSGKAPASTRSTGEAVRTRLAELLAAGVVRRIAAVPNHYRLGYAANGMSVWDVADAEVDALARQVAQLPGVSHCYLRPRSLPVWPYNLFAMLHGRSRDEVAEQAAQLAQLLGPHCRQHDILYSSAVLKKTGLRLKED